MNIVAPFVSVDACENECLSFAVSSKITSETVMNVFWEIESLKQQIIVYSKENWNVNENRAN